jgi:hypothetical protein
VAQTVVSHPPAAPRGGAINLVKLLLAGLVAAAMLLGVWSALLRLGWGLPAPLPAMSSLHGPLMIGGVLGTLIGLERAVAMAGLIAGRVDLSRTQRWHWAYLAPVGSGLGALLLLAGATTAAQLATILASVVLVTVYGRLLRLHLAAYTLVMGGGALMWLAGNLLWLSGQPFYLIVHWWIAFLVLTVIGERLELARMTSMTTGRRNLLLGSIGVYVAGLVLTLAQLDAGVRVAGLGQILLGLWAVRYDIARRTMHKPGIARYIALCLMSGYVWLGIAGLLGLRFGAVYGGFAYDALIHAVLFGFIFAMIFGHAPIILPALTGLQVRFHRAFYAPLVALHLTLFLRVAANLSGWIEGRMWGGLLNAVTLALFFAIVISSCRQGASGQERVAAGD